MDYVVRNYGFSLFIFNALVTVVVCVRVWRRRKPGMHPVYFVLCAMYPPRWWQGRPDASANYGHPTVREARAKILSEGVPVMILAYVLVYIWTHAYR
jgi:hypothetical protein